jgi:hypothetical protein
MLLGLLVLTGLVITYAAMSIWHNPGGQGWRSALLLLAFLVTGVFFWRHCQKETKGNLRFDGERWWFQPKEAADRAFDEQVVRVSCIANFQNHLWLLMRWDFAPDVNPRAPFFAWACYPGHQDNAQWLAFRRAVFFNASANTQLHKASH